MIFSRKNDISLGRKHGKMAARQDDTLNRNPKIRMAKPPAIRRMRAGMYTALALLIAAAVAGAAVPSEAQTVPIPKPAPKGRDVQLSASEPRAPMTTGATQTAPPRPPTTTGATQAVP